MGWLKRWWGIDEREGDDVAAGMTVAVGREGDDAPGGEMPLGDGMVGSEVLCAWCLAEQGLAFGEGSHGICSFHAEQMLHAQRERRGRRG